MNIPTFNVDNVTTRSRYNRGTDNKYDTNINVPLSVGLVDIDTAILKFLQDKVKPITVQDTKQIQIPVIYGNPERWKSAQIDGSIRDKNGMVMLPIMMIRRTTMKKSAINNPTNKHQNYVFSTKWNARNMYDRFAIVNNITPSQVYHSTMVPDYYDITYEGMVWTEYMEQMNKIIENISFESNEYWGDTNNFKFRAMIDQFEQMTDLPSKESRLVRNKFSINVKAYILPQSALNRNGNRAMTSTLVYSPKKLVFTEEFVTKMG